MTITAKYPATCSCCHAAIRAGDQIEWVKGAPVRHAGCATRATPTTVAGRIAARRSTVSRGGKWTGCSCGSREDSYGDLIPSARNCFSCRHDSE